MSKTASWSEYWEKEGASGEVFVGKEGKKHPFLSEFWQKNLEQFTQGSKIVDLACGGGSIFADTQVINESKKFKLSAVDVSAEALKTLSERLPEVSTFESSVDSIAFDSASFDGVVSQFGIEYAGIGAFKEAARLLADEGRLVVICHIEDGFIDSKNKIDLAGAQLLLKTGFIDKAIAITESAFAKNVDAFKESNLSFSKVEPEIAEFVGKYNYGIHAHCYAGFRQMFQRKDNYHLNDIVDWLVSMREEVETTIARLNEMRRAAQSEKQIEVIKSMLEENGLNNLKIELFIIPGHKLPLAWAISGIKSKVE